MSYLSSAHSNVGETRYKRDTTLFPIPSSQSVRRKPSLSKAARMKQPDALSFGSNIRTVRSRHACGQIDFLNRINEADHVSLCSEVSDVESRIEALVPFSPLSMLFEGIIADSQSDCDSFNAVCHDDSPYPYSPVSDLYRRGSTALPTTTAASPERREYAELHSGSSSPSGASSIVMTPESSPYEGVAEILDQALAELIAENAVASANPNSSTNGLPEPGDSLLLGSDLTTSASDTFVPEFSRPPRKHPVTLPIPSMLDSDDVDPCRLTMPGGGPLFEPHGSDSRFSPFWDSPRPSVCSQQTVVARLPIAEEAAKAQNNPPPRPPRPKHCSITLEDFGNSKVCEQYASPSLKSVRKTPAEYLQTHRRSSSIYSLENFKSNDLSQFKLAPAPTKANRPAIEEKSKVDRNSIVSTSTFVSAKSDSSTKPLTRPIAASKGFREPVPVVVERVTLSEAKDFPRMEPLILRSRDRTYLPSAHRLPRPRQLALPEAVAGPVEQKRKTSLLRKISHSLKRSKEAKSASTGPTDYSKISPSASFSNYSATITPFPLSEKSPLHLTRSVSQTPPHQSDPSLARATSRYRTYSTASRTSADAIPPSVRSNRSNLQSHPPSSSRSRSRSTSTSSNVSHSTVSSAQTLPRKSSLKRKASISSAASHTLSLQRTMSSRSTIVDSATQCVMSSRKVTFGEVKEYSRPSSGMGIPIHPHDQCADISTSSNDYEGVTDEDRVELLADQAQESSHAETQQVKMSYVASLRGGIGLGFGISLSQLGWGWGRKA